MDHVINDGGRVASGFKGSTGDCVTRAIAIAAKLPYADVYDRIQRERRGERAQRKTGKRSSARTGVFTSRTWFKRYMTEIGFEWISCMSVGSGCTTHLDPAELPAGRIIVSLSRHYAAVIDRVLHDTYDCSRNGTRCVYGYWRLVQ